MRAEVEVRGNEEIIHRINGVEVLRSRDEFCYSHVIRWGCLLPLPLRGAVLRGGLLKETGS